MNDQTTAPQPKSPADSATTLAQVMFPEHANVFMTVHGGELLKMMDTAAGVCASRHQGTAVNTRAIGGLVFHEPVPVNCLVTCQAHITYTSGKVIEVFTELWAETVRWAKPSCCVTGYFYYVGIDLEKKCALPAIPLKLSTPEEEKAFAGGAVRLKKNMEMAQYEGNPRP